MNKEQCNHCQQKFGTIDELEAHIEKCNRKGSVSNISQVNDKPDKKVIDNSSKEEDHDTKSKDKESKKHQCEVCHVLFPAKSILIKHVTLDHPDAQIPEQSILELPLSKRRRQQKKKGRQEKIPQVNIEDTEQSKIDAKKYKCALCSQSFYTKIKRIAHIRDAHKGTQKSKA